MPTTVDVDTEVVVAPFAPPVGVIETEPVEDDQEKIRQGECHLYDLGAAERAATPDGILYYDGRRQMICGGTYFWGLPYDESISPTSGICPIEACKRARCSGCRDVAIERRLKGHA